MNVPEKSITTVTTPTTQERLFPQERPQLLTFFVAVRNSSGELLLGPQTYKTRAEAYSYVQSVLGGRGVVVLAAGKVSLELVKGGDA